jgi:hypothetical protein
LIQTVARIALDKSIIMRYPLPSASVETRSLSLDEHNTLRYCAGYVLRSLKKRYPTLVPWLNKLTDAGGSDTGDSFSEFTKMWVEKVNRGGLILVSDGVYDVFHTMKLVLRAIPKHHKKVEKENVIHVLQADNEIQFNWSIMTSDIDSKTSQDVIKLWITIRCYSYAKDCRAADP